MIVIENLFVKFIREFYALYNINLEIAEGENVIFCGGEKCGKTTLLRVIAKLEKYNQGEVYLKGMNLAKLNFKDDVEMGYIPKNPIFFDNKTVKENLEYVLKSRKIPTKEIEHKVNNCIIANNIAKEANMKICDLDMFTKQKIALIRLTLRNLDVVLIDNIFKQLDEEQNEIIKTFIKNNFFNSNATVVVAVRDENKFDDFDNIRKVKFLNGSIVK